MKNSAWPLSKTTMRVSDIFEVNSVRENDVK